MKKLLAVIAFGSACAACCAPLLSLLFGGLALGTLAGALTPELVVCGAVAVLVLGLLVFRVLSRRRARKARCDCQSSCQVG